MGRHGRPSNQRARWRGTSLLKPVVPRSFCLAWRRQGVFAVAGWFTTSHQNGHNDSDDYDWQNMTRWFELRNSFRCCCVLLLCWVMLGGRWLGRQLGRWRCHCTAERCWRLFTSEPVWGLWQDKHRPAQCVETVRFLAPGRWLINSPNPSHTLSSDDTGTAELHGVGHLVRLLWHSAGDWDAWCPNLEAERESESSPEYGIFHHTPSTYIPGWWFWSFF